MVRTRGHSQGPLQYAGIPVPSTRTGIRPPGMHGRQLAATDSPNAAPHSWGRYANLRTKYSSTRVLRWLSQVQVLRCAQDDKAVRVLPFSFAQGRQDDNALRTTQYRKPSLPQKLPHECQHILAVEAEYSAGAAAGPV